PVSVRQSRRARVPRSRALRHPPQPAAHPDLRARRAPLPGRLPGDHGGQGSARRSTSNHAGLRGPARPGREATDRVRTGLRAPADPARVRSMAETGLQSQRHRVADADAALELFHERGWTDGLPIVPPTEERVRRMLAGAGRSPDEVLGSYST